ncbi:MAG: hypothetical protein WDN69_37300 [Aliidongia sp.]
MLLEALVACAGVTLRAVSTALKIELRGGRVAAEGDLDFRGTLGVDKEAPVGSRTLGFVSISNGCFGGTAGQSDPADRAVLRDLSDLESAAAGHSFVD